MAGENHISLRHRARIRKIRKYRRFLPSKSRIKRTSSYWGIWRADRWILKDQEYI